MMSLLPQQWPHVLNGFTGLSLMHRGFTMSKKERRRRKGAFTVKLIKIVSDAEKCTPDLHVLRTIRFTRPGRSRVLSWLEAYLNYSCASDPDACFWTMAGLFRYVRRVRNAQHRRFLEPDPSLQHTNWQPRITSTRRRTTYGKLPWLP